MRRLVIAAVAVAAGVIAGVAATRRKVPPMGGTPPSPPGAGVREPRVPTPLAPAGQAFVDD